MRRDQEVATIFKNALLESRTGSALKAGSG